MFRNRSRALIFAFCFLPFAFLSAQNVAGVWQGVIYQPSGGSTTCYPTTIVLQQNGSAVTGSRKTTASNSATAYVETAMGGSLAGNILSIKDLVFTSFVNAPMFEWCMIEGDLTFDAAAQTLKGTLAGMTASGAVCQISTIELYRLQIVSPLIFCKAGPQTLQAAGQNVKWYADEAATQLLGSGAFLTQNIAGPTTFWATQTTSHCNFESPASPVAVGLTDLAFSNISLQNPGCGPGLLGSIEVAAAGGEVPYQFQINTSAFQNSLIFNELGASTYVLTVIDGAGCTASESVTLVPPSGLEVIAIGSATSCDGADGTATATVTSGVFPFDFAWSNGWPFQNQMGLGAGDFTITVTDAAGCSATATATVATFSAVILEAAEDTLWSAGGAVGININSNRLLTELAKISWSPAEFLNCLDCLDPSARPDSTTLFTVSVVDTMGCAASAQVLVIVKRPDPELIFLPNIFSPDDDGLNDAWRPEFSSNVELVAFAIFDRWGDLVFKSEDPAAAGWDGAWKGRKMDNGIYPFWIKYRANGLPEVKLKEGDLLLAR